MISRRGLFRLLTGAVASPVLKPLAALVPAFEGQKFTVRASGTIRILESYYAKGTLEALRNNTCLFKMCQPHPMPVNTGKTIQFFTYKLPEGAVETV